MHFALAAALCNFLPRIRQPHIGTVAFNQSLLSVLPELPHLAQDRRTMSPK
jgi:hypothetical protein